MRLLRIDVELDCDLEALEINSIIAKALLNHKPFVGYSVTVATAYDSKDDPNYGRGSK